MRPRQTDSQATQRRDTMSAAHDIPILDPAGGSQKKGELKLYPIRDAWFQEIEEADARANTEARWQIREACEYEYALPDGQRFAKGGKTHPVVSESERKPNEGRIRPGNYVGRLKLEVVSSEDGHGIGFVELESTSVKMEYRADYRRMLTDLAEKSAELLMSSEEFVFQKYGVDYSADAETLYQQFAFAKSLIVSDNFDAAIAKICSSPIRAMRSEMESVPMTRLRHLSGRDVRRFASADNRMKLPPRHSFTMRTGIPSVPCTLSSDVRKETADVPENRFVKFALEGFLDFLRDISILPQASTSLREEASALADTLEHRLNDPLFRELSRLDRMPLSSPALQRREGYREILRAWLMFESAAKLAWSGGEDVYDGGKRNVATLYEYWAFFKLLDIVSGVFDMEKKDLDQLIVSDKGRLELSLRQGKSMVFRGRYAPRDGSRELKIQFTYNKTFRFVDNIERQGSWTVDMRPDYTLSIWPWPYARIEDAEKIDAVVHIHFDAKYKIDKFLEIFGDTPSGAQASEAADAALNKIRDEEARGEYKRGDLLKMHSYNDAIRRTYGSYILYPGDKDDPKRRYREIIPGIGAFKLRPGNDEPDGAGAIKTFIRKVTVSLQNRLTQRERLSIYGHRVHKDSSAALPMAARSISLPVMNSRGELFVPADEPVLIGYFHAGNLDWIKKNGYNFRVGLKNGSLGLGYEELKADYLLLHSGSTVTSLLFRIDKEKPPKLMSKSDLIRLGYPSTPSGDAYLLFKLFEIKDGEPLYGMTCDISKLSQYAGGRASSHPLTVTFHDLMLHAIVSA